MPDAQPSTRQSLAEVIIGLAFQFERQSACGKGAEALAGGAVEPERDRVVRETHISVAGRDLARQRRADRAIGVGDVERGGYLLVLLQRGTRQVQQGRVHLS